MTALTRKQKKQIRLDEVVDYINSFPNAKCYHPAWKIAQILGYSSRTIERDITHLIQSGAIDSKTRKRGYKTIRTLIGDPNAISTYVVEGIEMEDFKYDRYRYRIPNKLPKEAHRGIPLISTTYQQRPTRKGKAIDIDWEFHLSRGATVEPRKVDALDYFAPFDSNNFVVGSE